MTGPTAHAAGEYEYQTHDRSIDRTVTLRQASMERDLGRLHRWLGSDHVKPYWQLDLPLPAFRRTIREKQASDHLTPYIGCLDFVPMSYWECYWAAEDDIANHYDAGPSDQGVHLLIGPEEYLGQGYAFSLLRAVVAMQFRHPGTERVIAEPDARNDRAISVFEQCGFEPRGEFYFEEVEKDALLLVCERDRFESEVLDDATAAPTQGVAADD
ncbi:siderophore biosynthesis protein [Natrialba chahannaoensis JCM 10990]|uniref:Siderophore biosynthesis protein n=1 Tax=Natrialba chahannaoensis JCM 10990 TaxID=1227492 RepID=M0A4A7_9EURY|nr:GNAT family N-acetyltransferase [Natrialba chahannaoensis]ELY93555.1 siderophore biosynthesis protein [Natrialba chahannaoensis JCM 10990]